jgi:zinc protease
MKLPNSWRPLVVILFLIASSSSAFAQLPPWSRFKLDNGLEVLVVENHAVPIVTIEIAVKNGSFTEPPEYNGLSHLYEHMFFTANARERTEDEFLEKVDDLGIIYNGETHEENVQYYFTLPKENFEQGLDFMATAITSPLFHEVELQKQRDIVLGEFDRNEALPLFNFGRKIARALWGDHISRKEPLGERSMISNATREQMRTIQRKYYIPNNSLLIVAGDVKLDEVKPLVAKYFEKWQAGPDPFKNDPPPVVKPLKQNVYVIDTVDQPTATAMIRWHGPSIGIDDKGTYAADVFSFIITQSEHEFKKKLEESGLAQGTNFWYYTQRYVGPIQADIQTTPENLQRVMQTFWEQVEKFDDPNYYTDEELETAKQVLRTQTLYRSEQLSTFAQDLAFWWASTGLDYYEKYLDNLMKITRKDIKDYVTRYIQNKPHVFGVAISEDGARRIKLDMPKLGSGRVKP